MDLLATGGVWGHFFEYKNQIMVRIILEDRNTEVRQTKMNSSINQKNSLSDLVDIRDVKIDRTLPTEERVKSYVEQIKNPYCFRVGDVKVRISYSKEAQTMNDSFSAMIASM